MATNSSHCLPRHTATVSNLTARISMARRNPLEGARIFVEIRGKIVEEGVSENHADGIMLGLELDAVDPSVFQLHAEHADLPLNGFIANVLAFPDIINERLDGKERSTGGVEPRHQVEGKRVAKEAGLLVVQNPNLSRSMTKPREGPLAAWPFGQWRNHGIWLPSAITKFVANKCQYIRDQQLGPWRD